VFGDADIPRAISMKKSLSQRRVPRKIGQDDDDVGTSPETATGEFALCLQFEIWPASDPVFFKQLSRSGD